MESELVALFEAAKKAADTALEDDDPCTETSCIDALKHLRDFPVNYQILVSTQVGKRFRDLTKHPKKNIQSFAIDLLQIWKNIIVQETARKNNSNSSCNNSTKDRSLNVRNRKSQAPLDTGKSLKVQSVKVEKIEQVASPRPHKVAKMEHHSLEEPVKVEIAERQETHESYVPKLPAVLKTNDGIRDKMREMLLEALSKVTGEVDDKIKVEIEVCDPIRVAVKVESVMFENWGRSTGPHKFKYRSIIFNIKDSNNRDFRRKVLLGEIKPERICSLTTDEMASDQRRLQNKEIEEKKLFDCERSRAPKATTDQFRCGRCRQRKCTYYQLQTRSADEPMTTFVTCVNCNNHWKFC